MIQAAPAANPTVEQDVPDCPYCDRPIDGKSVNKLHPACHEFFSAEMEEAFPEQKPAPQEPDFFPLTNRFFHLTSDVCKDSPNLDDAECVF